MNSATTVRQIEFAPPPARGTGRSLLVSLLAHALLVVALTAGINWKRDNSLSAEAEVWSAVPQAAAPKLVEVEPPPPPPPPPPPQETAKPAPPPAPDREADIALAKRRKAEDDAKKLEAQREQERRRLEELQQAEEKKQQALKEKLKAEEDKRKQEAKQEQDRKDKEKREKDAKKAKEEELKKQQAQKDKQQAADEAKKLDAIRRDNLKRLAGLAGASGGENASGNALASSGPSSDYGGRIRGRVKPNIVFTEDAPNNNAADVEVRCAPDGTIVSRKLIKSSGNTSWDNAVLKAIDKTEVLPRDIDGRVHSPLIISFRPKD